LIKGLKEATLYYYRPVAMNDYGVTRDTLSTFQTISGLFLPDLVTLTADSITGTSVRLRAKCNPNGSKSFVSFVWGVGAPNAYGSETPQQYIGHGTTDTTLVWTVPGLVPNVTYYYQAAAVFPSNDYSRWYSTSSEKFTFTTLFDSASKGMSIPIKLRNPLGYTPTIRLGVHTFATACIDTSLGELTLPPPPPGLDFRLTGRCVGLGTYYDYRTFVSTAQIDTYRVVIYADTEDYPMTLSWPNPKSVYAGSVSMINVDTVIDMKEDTTLVINSIDDTYLRIIAQYPRPVAHFPDVVTAGLVETPAPGTTLNALINPNGLTTESWFEWGEGETYDNHTPVKALGGGLAAVPVGENLTGLSSAGIFRARVVAKNADGLVYGPDLVFASLGTTGVNDAPRHPVAVTLAQNYPNPFNPSTFISYTIPRAEHVRLQLFNLLGELVGTLVDEEQQVGSHNAVWDAGTMASGLYFYRLTAGVFMETKKAILLR
jgi:hypothetical protein